MTELALIGKKIGMTREFYKTGRLVPVTVIKMEKARVISVIEEDKRGYKFDFSSVSIFSVSIPFLLRHKTWSTNSKCQFTIATFLCVVVRKNGDDSFIQCIIIRIDDGMKNI